MKIDKPKFGDACNGCGFCCQEEVCEIGKAAFGDIDGPCPGLLNLRDRYWCSLVLAERLLFMKGETSNPVIEQNLGIGLGCDSDDV